MIKHMNYPDVKRREPYFLCSCLVWVTLLTLILWTDPFPCAYAFLKKTELDLLSTEEKNCLRRLPIARGPKLL